MQKATRLMALMAVVALAPAMAVGQRCSDSVKRVEARVQARTLFEADFGEGLVWTSLGASVDAQREAVSSLRKLTEKHPADVTVLAPGASERDVLQVAAEAFGVKPPRPRSLLTFVLLPGAASPQAAYAEVRPAALGARDWLTRRFDWTLAKVTRSSSAAEPDEYHLRLHEVPAEELRLVVRSRAGAGGPDRRLPFDVREATSLLPHATMEQLAGALLEKQSARSVRIQAASNTFVFLDMTIAP